MEYNTDTQLILNGLYRDKAELSKKLSDIDKLIKKIKMGTFALDSSHENTPNIVAPTDNVDKSPEQAKSEFPLRAELRVQVISVMDMIGVACRLKAIQDKYKELTGLTVNLRETTRTLSKHKILRLLKPKGTERGLYWVKEDWLEADGTRLKEQHKFEGFSLIYNDEDLEFVQH